jgi:hypothetical protein
VGSGTISPLVSGTGLDNYAITSVNGAWSITPAPVTATAGSYSSTYDGVAHAPTDCAVTGAYKGDLSCTNDLGSVGPDVGSGSVAPVLVLNSETETNFTVTLQDSSWEITKAAATIVVVGHEGVYDGQQHGATLTSATGVNSEDLSSSVIIGTETYTDVPGGTVDWSFDHINYVSQNDTVNITISKAAATIVVAGYEGVYDGQPHGATLTSATGVNSEDLSGSVIIGTEIFTDVPGGTVDWSFEHNNYVAQNGMVDIEINKTAATIIVTGYEGVYDGDPHGATLTSATGVNSEDLSGSVIIGTEIFTDVPGGTVDWSFDHINYVSQNDTVNITISKAAATIVVSGYEGVYDGQPHGATLTSATGVNREDLSGSVILGTEIYTDVPGGTVDWSFDHINYVSQNDTVNITISKAAATIVVAGYEGVYDGQPHGAKLTLATGVNGEDLSSSVTVGTETFTNVPGGQVVWSFKHNNYEAQNGTAGIVITKADATIVVDGKTVTYDGEEHVGTGSATGVKGEALAGLDLGAKFTNVPGGTANWTFTDVTGNYNNASGSVGIVIEMVDADCSITGYIGVYDGDPHAASGECTGVKSETLAGLNLGDSFTNVTGGTAKWTFIDVTGNYNDVNGSVEIVITKADATIVVDGKTVTYDGKEHGASGTATGVKGETLAGLDLGDKFTNVPGGTAYWNFTDETGNYNDTSGSIKIVINKANPSCSISGYTGIYDAEPHGASGACIGVNYETLAELSLGAKFMNVPGGTANWRFNDVTGNYNNASGTVEIVINKANPSCSISGYTGIYDGDPHSATGSCTGVKDEILTTLDLGGTFTNYPGGTANWSFTDTSGNYNDASGSVNIVINQATLIGHS